ncbi:MAG: CDP-alcohol phosphatidyltransferase family protein [Candidatus Marinimicrobia bacterium]|nr:CDP-alcohol phosphatidyltransferase family protein [Candidatus Neomarinimicrobiota bacterium]
MTNQNDNKFRPHVRINDTVLGALERRSLQWFAKRMPAWVSPDILTGLGLLATIIIFCGYWLSNFHPGFLWLASFGFLLNWFGDSLDGNLARFRHIERPKFGFYIDHTTDAIGQVFIILGLGMSPYITFNVALLVLVAYLLLSVHVYIRTYVMGVFRISYYKMGPTEVRAILILFNILMFFFGAPKVRLLAKYFTLYDLLTIIAAGIMFILFLGYSLKGALDISKSEIIHKNHFSNDKANTNVSN